MNSGETISACGKYRYGLWREWDGTRGTATFVGLNPSTPDANTDDSTVRRCVGFCKLWGYGGFTAVNLFAFRATDPKDMKAALNPVGIENDFTIQQAAFYSEIIVCAWGNHGSYLGRDKEVTALIKEVCTPYCLGITKSGQPKHPLYLKSSTKLQEFP